MSKIIYIIKYRAIGRYADSTIQIDIIGTVVFGQVAPYIKVSKKHELPQLVHQFISAIEVAEINATHLTRC
jgi:hypothetical protein